ncbi:choice-of-anchor L domain-containing protein [Psychrosphaera ytuae]|uniref:Choice-of-anchor L domain-containing protein n=1 Tax=Psychrosphaera ytuae TaxID=2820710 RepID=A0A975DA24_9GAMM|nr:choice-of-anchor L domain-containing protein [Psychrosphaera ytuae]QTH63079.1 choice-of-anchor L domain-containing protein [Psychrosphaera ytuae]
MSMRPSATFQFSNLSLVISTVLLSASIGLNAETTGANGESVSKKDNVTVTTTDIINEISGSDLVISNIVFSGNDVQIGLFRNFDFLFDPNGVESFNNGVILSTGDVEGVVGNNASDNLTTLNQGGGAVTDNDLNESGFDIAKLTFQVNPTFDTLILDFVFGSDEYNEYVYSGFNDKLKIRVDDDTTGPNPFVDCALTPDGQAFSIDSVNRSSEFTPGNGASSNPDLYISNDFSDGVSFQTQMDGFTKRVTCRASVVPGQPANVAVGVVDDGDGQFDSWAFFRAKSLRSEPGGDYGDAPDSYQTLVASSGANHTIKEGVYIGLMPTGDTDGYGDGVEDSPGTATDDVDDGVDTFPQLVDTDSSYSIVVNATSINGSNSTIVAWIDFDRDGIFESGEETSVAVPSGTYQQDITVTWSSIPVNTQIGDTYARIRIANDGDGLTTSTPTGSVASGEVEDYKFVISGAGDVTPPDVVIDPVTDVTTPNGNLTAFAVTGSCTVGDGDVTVLVSDQDGSPANISSTVTCKSNGTWSTSFDVTSIDDGPNAIEVDASQTDAQGNVGNALQVTANKDITPPALTIDSPNPANSTNSSSYDVTGMCESGGTLVTVAISGATPATQDVACNLSMYTANFDVSSILDGANQISINVSQDDSVGNSAAIGGTENKDTVSPLVTINALPAANASNQSTYPVSGSCTSADGNVTVTLPGAPGSPKSVACSAGSWSTTFDVSGVSDGTNTIAVDAAQTDAANNTGNATQQTASKDTAAPVVTTDTPPVATQANQNTYTVTGTCTTSDGSVTVSIPGATPASTVVACSAGNWSATFDVSAIADNTNAISVNASQTDSFSNTGNATTQQANKDATAPVVTINSLSNANIANSNSYPLSGSCSSGDGNVTVTVAGATPSSQSVACSGGSWSASTDVSALSDGANVIAANASQTDAVGNTGNAAQQTGNKDTVAPTLSIDNAPTDITTLDPITLTFNFSEDVSGFTQGDIVVVNGAVTNFISVTPQQYTVEVTPDGNGNVDVSVANNTSVDNFANPNLGDSVLISYDSDNDGLTDNVELALGTDPNNPDSDGDGVPDAVEVVDSNNPVDSDNDGVIDALDPDDDNDGIATLVEDKNTDLDGDPSTNATDTDGDGTPDYLDTDSDGDNITDVQESGASTLDTDGDGIVDSIDVDQTGGLDLNNDGVDDTVMATNTDSSSALDYLNLDSDGDGIPDFYESGAVFSDTDTDLIDNTFDVDQTGGPDVNLDGYDDSVLAQESDLDGSPDYQDIDSDNDGIPDNLESGIANIDTDNDGILDAFDVDQTGGIDANNDGIDDNVSNALNDQDGDGIPDFKDIDSDNDGLPDVIEMGSSGVDTDGDGIDDAFDVDQTGGADANGDGIDDALSPFERDFDGDGTPDYLDNDSDNDGVIDGIEAGVGDSPTYTDTDGDGTPDAVDVDQTGGTDANQDGIDDAFTAVDTDGDGAPDYLDRDADGDGLPDAIEGNTQTDTDGVADYRDSDSDGDGVPDGTEAMATGIDSDGDGIDDAFDVDITGGTDANNDGVDDNITFADSDEDGVPDYIDSNIDTDGDGLSDLEEGTTDTDNDGLANYEDTDSDNDGIPDSQEGIGDADGDGIRDFEDLDSDNDGILDSLELNTDSDGDGIPDYIDTDSDNDGIEDSLEGAGDFDGDGIPDYLDNDSDNDGIDDSLEGSGDFDGDGIPDYLDNDADNDGIPDLEETAGDSDGDGIPDYLDTDSDNDGIEDSLEGAGDFDGDGIPDYLDNDSDNDGIDDSLEGAGDFDGDGIPDYLDNDADNDGIPDLEETAGDSDGDGTPNYLDTSLDEDGDGIPDIIETSSSNSDVDGDGIPNFLDADSDNDGLADRAEYGLSGIDSDNDGLDDVLDVDATGGTDANGDGIDDDAAGIQSDNDGTFDFLDRDSDNDGVPDAVEYFALQQDSDNDGVLDGYDVDQTGGVDTNNNGIDDAFDAVITEGLDTDGDGIDDLTVIKTDVDGDGVPDFRDPDSDNDGIVDGIEANVAYTDSDGDGIDDAYDSDFVSGEDANSDGVIDAVMVDTDMDGVLDMHDLDSDNDGQLDTEEAPSVDTNNDGIANASAPLVTEPVDTDNDGIYDFRDLDSDGDGIYDIANTPEQAFDTDGDGQIDFESDVDGDGIEDTVDSDITIRGAGGNNDVDFDGAVNAIDNDDDNDGISDIREGNADSDGDTVIDSRDADSDNDGIPDYIETDRPPVTGLDSDFDGIDDAYDVDATGGQDLDKDGVDDIYAIVDTDGDGTPDYLDTDSDNDGLSDTEEQAAVPLLNRDEDNDGIDDAIDVTYTGGRDVNRDGVDDDLLKTSDADGDGLLNYRDTDSDGDGIEDGAEGNGDSDGDGILDSDDSDSDNDGIEDVLEGNGDTDGDGIPDYLDLDSDGDGISDAVEGTRDSDGDGILDSKEVDADNDGIPDNEENGDFNGDGINDRLQAFKQVESTYTGSGSMTSFMVLLMAMFAICKRGVSIPFQKVIALSVIALIVVAPATTLAAKSESGIDNVGQMQLNDCRRLDNRDDSLGCWYVTFGMGQGFVYPDQNDTIWRVYDNGDLAYGLTVGYSFSPQWFTELNYTDFGEASLYSRNPSISQDLLVSYEGFGVDLGYWLWERSSELNVYVKAGAGFIDTTANLPEHHRQVESTQLRLGIGAQWNISEDWFFRAEHTRNDRDARMTSISIGYLFDND